MMRSSVRIHPNLPPDFTRRKVRGVDVDIGIAAADCLNETVQIAWLDTLGNDRVAVGGRQNTYIRGSDRSGYRARNRARRFHVAAAQKYNNAAIRLAFTE